MHDKQHVFIWHMACLYLSIQYINITAFRVSTTQSHPYITCMCTRAVRCSTDWAQTSLWKEQNLKRQREFKKEEEIMACVPYLIWSVILPVSSCLCPVEVSSYLYPVEFSSYWYPVEVSSYWYLVWLYSNVIQPGSPGSVILFHSHSVRTSRCNDCLFVFM